MDRQLLFPISIIIALCAIILYALMITFPLQPPESVACAADAKLCPDGSYVGRVPPACDFEQCPMVQDTGPETEESNEDSETATEDPGPRNGDSIEEPTNDSEPETDDATDDSGQKTQDNSTLRDTEGIARCEEWIGLDKKAECYSLLAQENDDVGYCNLIDAANLKPSCVQSFAIVNKNPSACVYAGEAYEKECFEESNRWVVDYSQCLGIAGENKIRRNARDACAHQAIKVNPDFEACKLTYGTRSKAACYNSVALSLKTGDACKRMEQSGLWESSGWKTTNEVVDCFLAVIDEDRDIGICALLEDDYDRWNCIGMGMHETRLSSNRCTGLSIDDEYFCRAIADDDKTLCEEIKEPAGMWRCKSIWINEDYCNISDSQGVYGKGYVAYEGGFFEEYCKDNMTLVRGLCMEHSYGEFGVAYSLETREYSCVKRCEDGRCYN